MGFSFFETAEAINGNRVTRIKSSLFYWTGLVFFIIGIWMVAEKGWFIGAGLSLTLAPCLVLYPPIRFLFGGKDSVAGVVATVVVEEVIKHKITNKIEKRKR